MSDLLQHDFSQAKMNKDLDERIVPQGQYRDALNIQVSTSDGSNVGSAQTLLGNTKKNQMFSNNGLLGVPSTGSVVAMVNQPEKDNVYYFVSGGDKFNAVGNENIRKDYIIQYNTTSETNKYVFVDIYNVKTVTSIASSDSVTVVIPNQSVTTYNATGVRVGMVLTTDSINFSDNITVTNIAYDAGNARWNITMSEAVTIGSAAAINFISKSRALNFAKNRLITGVNILDDFLFWTDNHSEPKKINIERSISGTGGTTHLQGAGITGIDSGAPTNGIFIGDTPHFHTRLVTSETGSPRVVTNTAVTVPVYVEEKHITVIRKAPTQPLTLKMFRSSDGEDRVNSSGVENQTTVTTANNFQMGGLVAGSTLAIDGAAGRSFALPFDARVGDKLFFIDPDFDGDEGDGDTDSFDEQSAQIIGKVTTSLVTGPDALFTTGFELEILSVNPSYNGGANLWNVKRGDKDALFEHEFVRFSYRYKYEDGEYSPFAPFSEVAFLSDDYDYLPKKGFNLGMRNQLKALKLTDYFHKNGTRPEDVVEIDLLLKKTNNPTVYSIKTLKPTDDHPIWPDFTADANARGEYKVTTDMVHSVVPANQIIRPYDNVPRKALAQEITANRLIYANYLQNYTVNSDPKLRLNLHSLDLTEDEVSMPSVKSLRKYQLGIVYSDDYGRETPVLTSKDAIIEVPKTASTKRNRLSARLSETTSIPSWAKYISYYVKETSSEYYSMAMDRWYEAADGNIWLSFPSSERNKMDEETFLILKKAHASSTPVTERARYKILAIENEAPDHIKTEKKSLGIVFDAGNNIGNSTRGWGGQDTMFVTVKEDAFEAIFGDDLHITQSNYDKLTLKFYGSGQRSKEYEIVKVSKLSSSYKLKFATKIDDDASFISSDDTYDNRIADLSIEVIGHKIENKPEFDGRFFVKVYRDEILEKYILIKNDVNYYVRAQWGLRYLNNDGYNVPSVGDGGSGIIPYNARERDPVSAGTPLAHPTQHNHHASYTWNSDGHDLHPQIERRSPHGINSNYLGSYSVSDRAEKFWLAMAGKQDFFIDAATAFSWTSRKDGADEDRPGNEYLNTGGLLGTDHDYWGSVAGANVGGHAADAEDGAPDFGGSTTVPGNMKHEKGQPSRGVWGNNTLMDISWTGMGTGYDANWDEKPFAHMIGDLGEDIYANASQFMGALVSEGTKFRFNRDPDETMYTVSFFNNFNAGGQNIGYKNSNIYKSGTTPQTGVFGIRNFTTGVLNRRQYRGHNMRQRWTIRVSPAIGSGPSGYNPVTGTINGAGTSVRALRHDGTDQDVIQIMGEYTDTDGKGDFTNNPAIWETEPKESVDVDIYYQASNLIPIDLTEETNEEFLPIGSYFYLADSAGTETKHTITNWTSADTFTFTPTIAADTTVTDLQHIHFYKRNNYWVGTNTNLSGNVTSGTSLTIHGTKSSPADLKLTAEHHSLDWSNCFVFGNGAESDRIRDDFNEKQFDNGVKASTVLTEAIEEERRKNGLIYSGIYNSNSGVNDTNQFIAGEAITKDIEPSFGSIQKLHTRNTNLLTLCEDKVVKILADKDALFNADGNTNVTATNKVLGAADAFKGNYGISTNPESFIATPYQIYFADPVRGQICALSGEGVRSISDLGMKDYFADLLKDHVDRVIGNYDAKKKEYNITTYKRFSKSQIVATTETASYNETKKGWVSFKSFIPQHGISLNNQYYTFSGGAIWQHHNNETRNNFYGSQYNSYVELLFNDNSTAVKSFGAINYEGTQAKVPQFTTTSHANTWNGDQSDSDGTDTTNFTDGEYYNLTASNGWYVSSGVVTDLQKGGPIYFKDKEGKWFGKIVGSDEGIDKLDDTWKLKEFSSQGLGMASISHSDPSYGAKGRCSIKNNESDSYQGDDGSGGAWDSVIDPLLDVAYSVTSALHSTQVGVSTGTPTINLTISNIVGGVYSGYNLSASNFSCPNKDSEVNSVSFTDNGTAGDPLNTVNVAVTLNAWTPTNDNYEQIIYIDIDSSGLTNKGEAATRKVCLHSVAPVASNSTMTVVDVTGITESTSTVGSSKISDHTGTIANESTIIASFTVACSAGYFIVNNNISSYFLNLGDYSPYYNSQLVANTSANGQVTNMTVNIFYTPPTGNLLEIDPVDMCDLAHEVRLGYKIGQIEAAVSNTITDVISHKSLSATPSSTLITVKGVPGTQYTIKAQKMASVGSGSVHSTNPYYNWSTHAFQSGSVTEAGTIGSTGSYSHEMLLGYHSADAQYDIIIAAAGSPAATLRSSVPNAAGEHSIIKRAAKSISVGPATSTASNFGTLPAAVVTTRLFKDSGGFVHAPKGYICYAVGSTQLRGQSKGVSATRLVLNDAKKTTQIRQGMNVFGTGVASGCTVVEIRGQYITLSAASTVSSAELTFVDLGSRYRLCSFTILPNSNTLSVNSSNTVESQFSLTPGLPISDTRTVNGQVTSGRVIALDNAENLFAGQTITGTNIGSGRTIASISSNDVTMSDAVTGTVADNAEVVFGGGLGTEASVVHESVTKVGNNIIIDVLMDIGEISESATATINIDNLITVS